MTLVFQMQDGASMFQRKALEFPVTSCKASACISRPSLSSRWPCIFVVGSKNHPKDVLCFRQSIKGTMFDLVICVVNNNFSFCKTFSISVIFNICKYFWF